MISGYWAILGPETILEREDNARLFEEEAAIRRGIIYDRETIPLVTSQVNAGNIVSRIYDPSSTHGLTGYYSLTYGVGGAEAAYDEILRGDDRPTTLSTYFEQDILHRDQQGANIRLTISLQIQQQLADALADQTGGGVIMSVPEGEIIALVSAPTFNPNNLDETWDELVDSPEKPFFNRVLQAQYQPGGLAQLVMIAFARVNNISLATEFDQADESIDIANTTLNCLMPPPSSTLSLEQAFLYGCPAPIQEIATTLGLDRTEQYMRDFFPSEAITLESWTEQVNETDQTSSNIFLTSPTPQSDESPELSNALGQGQINATPLTIAGITAAIINNGNSPKPHILSAIQQPESDIWESIPQFAPTIPIMTSETATQLRTLMRSNVNSGHASMASQTGFNIGGLGALAYSGERTLSWFTGFVTDENGQGYVITILLEDVASLDIPVSIGGQLLASTMSHIEN